VNVRIAVGADHRGYALKQHLSELLRQHGHEVVDEGCHGLASVDYPEPAIAVGTRVGDRDCQRGLLICGSGIGVCIAANKVPGVRAALCADVEAARLTRRHNDSNILCLSGDRTGFPLAESILMTWLQTGFEGGRHARRVQKIESYEHERDRTGRQQQARTRGVAEP
jgi:ribose 5-phosphate isomerase B